MAESRASIEERLALLVQEPNKKSICDRIPVRIFVVFMWIGFAVSMGISGYYITRWLKERSNYDSYKYKLIHVKEDIIHAQREQTALEEDIKQAQKEVAVIKGNIDKYRKENSALSEEIGHLKNSINYTHHAINETDEHIRSEKAEHSKLVEEDKRLTKELEDITKIYNEIMIKVNVSRRDLAIWKVGTGAGLLGSTLTALIGFRMTAELTQIQKKIKHASLIQKNFTRLSDEFGNALVRDIQAGGSITREVCYKWKSFKTPSNCNGKLNPTITIKTNSGYRFGVILYEEWKTEPHTCMDIQGFSSIRVGNIKPVGSHGIHISLNATHFQIGTTDILINLETGHGSSKISNFHSPDGDLQFFTDEANFVIEDLTVEIKNVK